MICSAITNWTVLLTILCSWIAAEDESTHESTQWKTGSALDRKAQLALSGQWADAPLRPLLFQLSKQQQIAIFVDRRVDPNLPVNLSARDLTWDQLLQAIGDDHGYGFCRLDDLYYFGPAEVSHSLPTTYKKLMQQLAQRRKELKVNWRKPTNASWARLSQPKELMKALAAENDVALMAGESIPLDVWPEFNSPEIPLVLRAMLLSIGFDKTIAISKTGARMKIVDYPDSELGTFTIQNLANPRSIIKQLQPQFSHVKFKALNKSKIELSGSVDQFAPAIRALVAKQVAIRNETAEARFTVKLKGKRGSILATIAKQLEINFEFEPTAADSLSEFIEKDFVDATAEEIIESALEGTGLKFQLNNGSLKIIR